MSLIKLAFVVWCSAACLYIQCIWYLDGLIFIILYTAKTIRNTIDKIKGTNNELQNTAEN
jgi:hypothetical protein